MFGAYRKISYLCTHENQKIKTMAETVKINVMPADVGVRMMLDMLKGKWVTELWGKSVSIAISGANHSPRNGKPHYLTKEDVASLQEVAHKAGQMLMGVSLRNGECSKVDSPLCYGKDWIEKFKTLRQYVSLPYIFQILMGWSDGKQKMYLSSKTEKYYNNFSEDQIAEINRSIRVMALSLCALELVWQEDPGKSVDESECRE